MISAELSGLQLAALAVCATRHRAILTVITSVQELEKKNWNRFHPFCTRTCSAHSDCSHLPTAKVCQIDSSLPNYNTCVECKNPTDCKAIGFKNHICPEGFCKHPNPAGTNYFLTGSNYCHSPTGAGCYADTMRCWAGCDGFIAPI